jgi:hypothetical protein
MIHITLFVQYIQRVGRSKRAFTSIPAEIGVEFNSKFEIRNQSQKVRLW